MLVSFILFTIPFVSTLIILVNLNSYIMMVIFIILYGIIIFSLIKGGCTDPGIIPRLQDGDSVYRRKSDYFMVLNGAFVKFTYCYTCNVFRPPRTSHCAVCDNCCQRFDHHCLWLGNCIGRRNYKYFFLLVTTLNITAIINIIYNICIILQSANDKEEKKIKFRIFTISILSAVSFLELMFIIFFLGKLQILHIRLLIQNFTFYEDFKKKLKNPAKINPYFKNIWQNVKRLLLLYAPKSLLNGNISKKKILSNFKEDVVVNQKYEEIYLKEK
jgi:palmitoyltransferase ZDHHC9/14/18